MHFLGIQQLAGTDNPHLKILDCSPTEICSPPPPAPSKIRSLRLLFSSQKPFLGSLGISHWKGHRSLTTVSGDSPVQWTKKRGQRMGLPINLLCRLKKNKYGSLVNEGCLHRGYPELKKCFYKKGRNCLHSPLKSVTYCYSTSTKKLNTLTGLWSFPGWGNRAGL